MKGITCNYLFSHARSQMVWKHTDHTVLEKGHLGLAKLVHANLSANLYVEHLHFNERK